MNRTACLALVLASSGALSDALHAGRPDVDTFLHSGELAVGIQTLEARLESHPDDDETRFGLGVLQVARAAERFGQSLYEYGANPVNNRLPLAENPNPAPITYQRSRRMLDDLRRDLLDAEATLAKVRDDSVRLDVRLARVRLDLDGDGMSTDRFIELVSRAFRGRGFDFLEKNPEFRIRLDRGDVAWLRGYCHLTCGVLDAALAFDGQAAFDRSADHQFAKPVKSTDEPVGNPWPLTVVEPLRLRRFRKHLVKVCELNHETWRHIRRETDDDHEWLPNPNQTGVLGLPVTDEMIDAWLAMADEARATLEGERTFLRIFISKDSGGLDLAKLFDDPPKVWGGNDFPLDLPDRYFDRDRDMDLGIMLQGFRAFGNSAIGYAIWFN